MLPNLRHPDKVPTLVVSLPVLLGPRQLGLQRDDDGPDEPGLGHPVRRHFCPHVRQEALELAHARVELYEQLHLVLHPRLLPEECLFWQTVTLNANLIPVIQNIVLHRTSYLTKDLGMKKFVFHDTELFKKFNGLILI